MSETNACTRYDFLDWLRVIAIFVLMFFHTGMLFVGWGWHIVNAEVIDGLQRPMDIAHRLRMPLLFMIAGAGMWYTLRCRSGVEVLKERTLRLLLPLVVGMFLIVPPQVYFERLFRHQWSGGYLDFMVERVLLFQPYPAGDFSWHHLWFILYLFVYALLLLPALLWWRKSETKLRPGLWLYSFAALLGLNEAMLKPLFPETHNLVHDWYVFGHYLLLTIFGVVLASMDKTWDWLAATRRNALAFSTTLTVVLLVAFNSQWIYRDTAADAFTANIFTWAWLLTMLGYGRRYLSFSNPLLRWARDASYPIYILHQTVIIAIAYFIIQLPWSPGVKYWAILAGTLLVCVVLYEAAIRRFAFMRLIFGMKRSRFAEGALTRATFLRATSPEGRER